jgi:YYY domain-containing protein
MIGQAFAWWLVVELLGLITLPIALTVFARLPGRGYAFSKPFSLLLGGYLFWMALSTHVLPNRPGSVAWVYIFLAFVSVIVSMKARRPIEQALRENLGFVIAVEVVFTVAFFTAGLMRSFIPEIAGTEKPMDFMLLNAVSRSRYYPPADPWLAGFDVSYYYFGYVIQAMVGKIAFLPTSVSFNLGLVSTAALAATAAFGLGYELASLAMRTTFKMALAVGAAAVVLVTLLGNLEGAIEFGIANNHDIPASLIERIDIANLDTAQASDACIVGLPRHCIEYPNEKSSFWWWWRSTRISPDGNSITEFPFFSFLLGDLHPHVMAIPFVFTVVGLGLALYRSAERLAGAFWRKRLPLLLVGAVLLGGLGFLNTWDLPAFGFLLALLVIARNLIERFEPGDALRDAAGFLAPLFLLAFLLYLPFYLSFGTQADGIEAVRNGATRPLHSFLFWAPLFSVSLPLPLFLLARDRSAWTSQRVMTALSLPVFLMVLWLLALAGSGSSVGEAISARGWNWLTTLFLMFSLVIAGLALFRAVEMPHSSDPAEGTESEASSEVSFFRDVALVPVLAMMTTAFLLILGGELFYVRDVFHSRLNTVFKLSYQAWLLLGLSGAFSVYWLTQHRQVSPANKLHLLRSAWAGTATLILAAAMLYPLGATLSRTEGLAKTGRTLDGLDFARRNEADDWAALGWLRRHADGGERLVEATGGEYSSAGRIAAWSGVPTVIGWAGHEVQWGRSDSDLGTRQQDVDRIYTSTSLGEALTILQEYGVTYVMVGSVELAKYPAEGLQKFEDLTPSFRSGKTAIYRVPIAIDESAASQ